MHVIVISLCYWMRFSSGLILCVADNRSLALAFIVCVGRSLMAPFGADTIRGVLHVSMLRNLCFVHIFQFVSVQRDC